jgi:type III restriction enzyme
MKDKERLLDLKTPLKFIFSHSALREGWDNPNVFQICTLREIGTERERRQTIGRGLRLCVNQHGDRLRGHDPNTLTVIANESYEDFAENLQREIEADTRIKFGLVEKHEFANLTVPGGDGSLAPLGAERSRELFEFLRGREYINGTGKVQDKLRTALKEGTLPLPEGVEEHREGIQARLRKLAGRLEVKNADDRRKVPTRQAVLDSEEFKALWERVRYKTTYRVQFDNQKLIVECVKAVGDMPPIPRTRVHSRKGALSISRGGIETEDNVVAESTVLYERDIVLPDLLTELEYKTKLTRRSLVTILKESNRLRDFTANPQKFLEQVVDAILRQKQHAIVDGIKYQRIGDEAYYAQELFAEQELTGYMKSMLEAQKAPHERIVYQSNVEREFAMRLEGDRSVKVYAKLPDWFKIPTPLGNYNPDWAVLIEQDGAERLYFVVETKGTSTGTTSFLGSDLRGKEAAKILCGKAHFEALTPGVANPARFIQARDFEDVLGYT